MNHIRQKIIFFKIVDRAIDTFLIICSFYLSIIAESWYHGSAIFPLNNTSFNIEILLLAIILLLAAIIYIEKHFFYRTSDYFLILKNVFLICLISFLMIIAINFLLKENFFYRSTIIIFTAILYIFLSFKRIFIKLFLTSIRTEGMDYKNIMIIGYGKRAKKLIKFLDNHKEYGMKVSSIIASNYNEILVDSKNGDFEDIYDLIGNLSIDDVFICTDMKKISKSEEIFELFYSYGLNVHIMTDIFTENYIQKYQVNPVLENFYGIPSFTYNIVQVSYYKLVMKNILERLLALILIIFSMPIIMLSILLIILTTKGPPLFTQKRVGLRGRIFKQYKLRTMISNAEIIKEELLSQNELDGPIFKIKDDPRITFIGKILRKFSIDELPQFFNVLKGDMNVVGPRPYPVREVENFDSSSGYELSILLVISITLSLLIGTLTFTGSFIAFGKLQGIVTTKPVTFPGQQILNAILAIVMIVSAFMISTYGINSFYRFNFEK